MTTNGSIEGELEQLVWSDDNAAGQKLTSKLNIITVA